MPFITWEDKFNTGVTLIDTQHKELVKLTNELFEACQKSDKAAMETAFKDAVRRAVDYVKVHFRDEEALQEKSSYPQYMAHKSQHDEFIRYVLSAVADYQAGKVFVPNTFVRYLAGWLLEHIAISDKVFGRYLIAKHMQG